MSYLFRHLETHDPCLRELLKTKMQPGVYQQKNSHKNFVHKAVNLSEIDTRDLYSQHRVIKGIKFSIFI